MAALPSALPLFRNIYQDSDRARSMRIWAFRNLVWMFVSKSSKTFTRDNVWCSTVLLHFYQNGFQTERLMALLFYLSRASLKRPSKDSARAWNVPPLSPVVLLGEQLRTPIFMGFFSQLPLNKKKRKIQNQLWIQFLRMFSPKLHRVFQRKAWCGLRRIVRAYYAQFKCAWVY